MPFCSALQRVPQIEMPPPGRQRRALRGALLVLRVLCYAGCLGGFLAVTAGALTRFTKWTKAKTTRYRGKERMPPVPDFFAANKWDKLVENDRDIRNKDCC